MKARAILLIILFTTIFKSLFIHSVSEDPVIPPVEVIYFPKNPKCASTVLKNTFLAYALSKNLSVVLPQPIFTADYIKYLPFNG